MRKEGWSAWKRLTFQSRGRIRASRVTPLISNVRAHMMTDHNSTKLTSLSVLLRVVIAAIGVFIGLLLLVIIGLTGSSIYAPRLAIEISKVAILVATASIVVCCMTPPRILRGRSTQARVFKYLLVFLAAQPLIVIPIAYKFFRHAL